MKDRLEMVELVLSPIFAFMSLCNRPMWPLPLELIMNDAA